VASLSMLLVGEASSEMISSVARVVLVSVDAVSLDEQFT